MTPYAGRQPLLAQLRCAIASKPDKPNFNIINNLAFISQTLWSSAKSEVTGPTVGANGFAAGFQNFRETDRVMFRENMANDEQLTQKKNILK